MIFSKKNYYMLIVSVIVLIFGFYLMQGTTDIMDPIKISVAPVVVIIGYLLGVYSILLKTK